jgi:hypothetical protein
MQVRGFEERPEKYLESASIAGIFHRMERSRRDKSPPGRAILCPHAIFKHIKLSQRKRRVSGQRCRGENTPWCRAAERGATDPDAAAIPGR